MTQSLTWKTPYKSDEVLLDVMSCYAPNGDGLITSIASFVEVDGDVVLEGYAVSEAAWHEMVEAQKNGEENLEDPEGRWADFWEQVVRGQFGFLRVDDKRPGRNYGYLVWLRSVRQDGFSLIPNAVYHEFSAIESDHQFPPCDSYDAVLALINHPEALRIDDVPSDLDLTDLDDPAVIKVLGDSNDRITVWNLGDLMQAPMG